MKNKKTIKIGITHGDVNGISYEIIMKALSDSRIFGMAIPILYGSSKVASYYRKTLEISNFNYNVIKSASQAKPKKPNLINVYNQEIKIDLGHCTETGGKVAHLALEAATKDLENGLIDVLVTAPINKQNIQSDSFNFQGHTEYLAKKFNADNFLMLMVNQNLKIGVITGHEPISKVPSLITKELIINKIKVLNQSLIKDFSIRKPKIAVLGLNPHSGDNGIIGEEEQTTIIPAIKNAFDQNILCFGPYPADGFFGTPGYLNFDGILAMYHDQGLIPFKALSFKDGVNFTVGLPIIRTSPAHGTAYNITGKNTASPDAMRQAIYIAIDAYRNRKDYEEMTSNPLKVSALEDDKDGDNDPLKDLKDDYSEENISE